jgi:hypothetical protein
LTPNRIESIDISMGYRIERIDISDCYRIKLSGTSNLLSWHLNRALVVAIGAMVNWMGKRRREKWLGRGNWPAKQAVGWFYAHLRGFLYHLS